MLNVYDYIKRYCKVNGIENFGTKSRVLTKEDFAKPLSFAPGVAFFYRLSACGVIESVNNLTESFLTASTPTEFFDFAKIAEIHDSGTIQHAKSDFIFVCDNILKLNLKEGANALFSQIYNIQLFYLYVTSMPPQTDGKNRQSVEIEIERSIKQ